MFRTGNLKKIFELLDETQKTYPEFSPEERLLLYRMSFYMESFEETRKAVLQAAVLKPGEGGRKALLEQYAQSMPESPNEEAAQLEDYIFQLQLMCHEQDKAIEILEQILKLNDNRDYDLIFTEAEGARTGKRRIGEENGRTR